MQYKRKGEHRAVCDVRRGISIDVENLIRIQLCIVSNWKNERRGKIEVEEDTGILSGNLSMVS